MDFAEKVMQVRKGLWRCSRCEFWWFWSVQVGVERLDRKCVKCNHRLQARLDRKPGNRGRPRTDTILEYPGYRPDSTIKSEQRRRNSRRARTKATEDRALGFIPTRFVKASRIQEKVKDLATRSQGDPIQEDDAE